LYLDVPDFVRLKKNSDDFQMGRACGTEQGVEGYGEERQRKGKTWRTRCRWKTLK
jgi:hypothetical protein